MSYVVTGALAVVPGPGGKLGHFYAGSVLPEEVPADVIAHLVDVGLVTEGDPLPIVVLGVDPDGEPEPEPAPKPKRKPRARAETPAQPDTPAQPATPAAPEGAGQGEVPPPPRAHGEKPLLVAAKAVWVDYAIEMGVDPDVAAAMDKADIVDRFKG